VVDKNIKAIISAEDRTGNAFKSVKNSVTDLAKGVAIGALAVDAFKYTMRQLGSTLQTGIKFEQFKVGFQTMTGSIQQGNLMLEKLYNFAETTPLNLTEVIDGAKRLMAMGVQATDVEARLRTLGNIASVVGTDKMPQLILAFGQVNTATRLYGQELRQFTEAGVPLLEELSKITGVSATKIKADMMNGIAVPAALVNQALENMTKEGGIAFNAMEKQSKTLGGSITRLKNQWTLMSAKIGELASTILVPLINKIIDFVKNNSSMIFSLMIATVAVIAFGGAIIGIIKTISFIRTAVIALGASFSWILIPLALIGVLLGVTVYKAMQNFQSKMKSVTSDALKNFGNIGNTAEDELGEKAAKAAQDLAETLEDIDRQIIKSNKTFTENLAEIVKTSQDKIKELNASVAEETLNYETENAKKLTDFTKTQQDMTTEHERKVAKIQEQIDEEVGYGWLADQQKLADLRQQLTEENTDYDSQFAENKTKYEEDTLSAKTEHDKKMLDFQTRLDAEKTLLENHSAEVLSIKDFQYRDEITKLVNAHQEELAEFDRQKAKAIQKAQEQGEQMMNANLTAMQNVADGNNNILDQVGSDMGESMGTALKNALIKGLKDLFTKDIPNMAGKLWQYFKEGFNVLLAWANDKNDKRSLADLFKASGGSVSSNTPYIVGEKGPELFVPQSNGNIIPNNQLATNHNFTINVYGNINNPQGFSPEEIGQIINRQISLSRNGAI
jgi:tape measure domain-containing protein